MVATAALMHGVGLSMALGAFLAGVLLADGEYRRELETDIEPFKGLLLGLFFIAVGMSIDFAVVARNPALVAAVVAGFLVVKAAVVWAMARAMPVPLAETPVFVILLAQGGEFGFVVFQTALGAGVIEPEATSLLLAAVAMSMLLTPLLLVLSDRFLAPQLAARAAGSKPDEISVEQHAPVIICGFGRYGQIVGRLINAAGLSATVLEHDAEQVEAVRRFGWQAFYGDATRLDLLRTAGAAKARVIVVAMDDSAQCLAVVDLATQHFPQAALVVRARNATDWTTLHLRGVQHVERETLDSALMSGRSVLELVGWQPNAARTQALRFRRHSIEIMKKMAPHLNDEKKLIAVAKQGRSQLEATWAQKRAEQKRQSHRPGWQAAESDED